MMGKLSDVDRYASRITRHRQSAFSAAIIFHGVDFHPILKGINIKIYIFVGLCSGFLVCGGCASAFKRVDVNKGLDSYYSQRRYVDLVTIKGSNMTISATGVNEMKVSSILPPLNVIPREPGLFEKLVDGASGVAKFGLGFYYGNQMLGKALAQPRTVSPEIVRPLVVQSSGQ